jgi:hypothetical protein
VGIKDEATKKKLVRFTTFTPPIMKKLYFHNLIIGGIVMGKKLNGVCNFIVAVCNVYAEAKEKALATRAYGLEFVYDISNLVTSEFTTLNQFEGCLHLIIGQFHGQD